MISVTVHALLILFTLCNFFFFLCLASPNILQQTALPILSLAQCQQYWGNRIFDSMICAGASGVSSCQVSWNGQTQLTRLFCFVFGTPLWSCGMWHTGICRGITALSGPCTVCSVAMSLFYTANVFGVGDMCRVTLVALWFVRVVVPGIRSELCLGEQPTATCAPLLSTPVFPTSVTGSTRLLPATRQPTASWWP